MGGTLGLFTGVSVITFIELLYWGCVAAAEALKRSGSMILKAKDSDKVKHHRELYVQSSSSSSTSVGSSSVAAASERARKAKQYAFRAREERTIDTLI